MQPYLLSIYQPDGPPPPDVDLARVTEKLGRLNADIKAAGAWVFTGGLHAPSTATVLRVRDDEVLTTDGPYVEGKEHLGGFTIVNAEDLDGAMRWGTRLAEATGLPIEVRPLAHTDAG
ncbi:MAG: YciI family protein [Solirubrobacteraceae bacterium]